MDLKEIVKLQMTEIDRLRLELGRVTTERDELRQHLENLAPGAPDAHACLRRIYNDPEAKEAERRAAASTAIGYERPKPAAVVNNVVSFKEFHATLESSWQRLQAEKHQKMLEAQVIEPSPTILGEGPEPAA